MKLPEALEGCSPKRVKAMAGTSEDSTGRTARSAGSPTDEGPTGTKVNARHQSEGVWPALSGRGGFPGLERGRCPRLLWEEAFGLPDAAATTQQRGACGSRHSKRRARNPKFKAPNPQLEALEGPHTRGRKLHGSRAARPVQPWSLVLGAYLELGAWCLDLRFPSSPPPWICRKGCNLSGFFLI